MSGHVQDKRGEKKPFQDISEKGPCLKFSPGDLLNCFSSRGLRFIQILLQSLADGERDENNPNHIRVNITKAYEQALKRYHGWIVQKIFKVRDETRELQME